MTKTKYRKSKIEYDELLVSESMKQFATALVSIFVPIYLYRLGHGLQFIFLFYLVNQVMYLLALRPVARLTLYLHPKRTICVSYICSLITLLLLSNAPSNVGILLGAAALAGLADCIFWIPYHANFSRLIKRSRAGQQLTTVDIAVKAAGIAGPLLGAVIASSFGTNKLFLVAGLLLGAATIPLLLTKDFVRQKTMTYSRVQPQNITWDLLATGSSGVKYLVSAVTWPIFLSMTLVTYTSIGGLVSLSMLAGFGLVLAVGRLNDRGWGRIFIVSGSIMGVGVNILRLGGTIFSAQLATIIDNIAESLVRTPFTAAYYSNAGRGHRLEYIVRLEQAAFIGRSLTVLVLLIASYVLSIHQVLLLSFGIAGLASLGSPLLKAR